jgi:hypothetical protein
VHSSIEDDDIEFGVVLQDLNVRQRIAVDKDAVRVVSRQDFAQFFRVEELGHARRGSDDTLMGREAE